MDGLTPEERAEAWLSAWDPSLIGSAILNQDFTFRSANQQFCDILGITPAQLYGQRMQDVSTRESREVDEKNAKLLIAGLGESYLLKKTYDFGDGLLKNVILLVSRVPKIGNGDFKFFLLRIVPAIDHVSLSAEMSPPPVEIKPHGAKWAYAKSFAEYWEFWWPKVALIAAGAATFFVTFLQGKK